MAFGGDLRSSTIDVPSALSKRRNSSSVRSTSLIPELVQAGYLVRTRADGDTE